MKKSILFIFLLFYSSSFGTCIVVLRMGSTIYVAADSKRTLTDVSGKKPKTFSQSICKIHRVNNFYFAISGHIDDGLLSVAKESLRGQSDITTATNIYRTKMTEFYKKTLTINRKTDPYFNYFLNNDLGAVAFFGFADNKAYIIEIDFSLKLSSDNKVVITSRIDKTQQMVVLGFSDHLKGNDELLMAPPLKYKDHPESLLKRMVQIEIEKHPDKIGEPIDVLKLTPTGEYWYAKNTKAVNY